MVVYRLRDQLILDVNDVWEQETGFRREEVVGRSQAEQCVAGLPADAEDRPAGAGATPAPESSTSPAVPRCAYRRPTQFP